MLLEGGAATAVMSVEVSPQPSEKISIITDKYRILNIRLKRNVKDEFKWHNIAY